LAVQAVRISRPAFRADTATHPPWGRPRSAPTSTGSKVYETQNRPGRRLLQKRRSDHSFLGILVAEETAKLAYRCNPCDLIWYC